MADALGQPVDEVLGAARHSRAISASISARAVGVGRRAPGASSAIGCTPRAGDDELDAGQPHAVVREGGQAEGLIGIADVEHDPVRGRGNPASVELARREGERAPYTAPVSPSAQDTVTVSPSARLASRRSVPTTHGTPSSRLTIAAWHVRPPRSVTMAAARFITGSQSGSVMAATSTSPAAKLDRSGGRTSTGRAHADLLTDAAPVTSDARRASSL